MKKIGEILRQKKINRIYLIHGTYAVTAPLKKWPTLLAQAIPYLPQKIFQISTMISNFLLELIYLKADDLGLFPQNHAHFLQAQFKIPIENFQWSGENHHAARFMAVADLMEDLVKKVQNNEHIIFLGHSHAGQIMALLSSFLWNEDFLNSFLHHHQNQDCSLLYSQSINKIQKNCMILKQSSLSFYYFTLGMAPRYPFSSSTALSSLKIFHIIHSPKGFPFARHWTSLFYGDKGDMIQQWALSGSDSKSFSVEEERLNCELDSLLGPGRNLRYLKKEIAKNNRLSSEGTSLLIDFGHRGGFWEWAKCIFGHGVYTQKCYIVSLWQIYLSKLP